MLTRDLFAVANILVLFHVRKKQRNYFALSWISYARTLFCTSKFESPSFLRNGFQSPTGVKNRDIDVMTIFGREYFISSTDALLLASQPQ